jgi:DNA-binding transcriptional regulator YiaG
MPAMPNIAQLLKAEIARVARKQVRADTLALKRALSHQRSEIAALKRELAALAKALRQARRQTSKTTPTTEAEAPAALRFNAKGLASHRRRLALSAADFGRLIGTSGQSVYLWESGRARPRASHLSAIAAVRAMGKREAAQRLEAMRGEG